jgi:hypothetical protein
MRLRYANTVEEIDAVEPMWNAPQEHHVRITPECSRPSRCCRTAAAVASGKR